jgi:hypothetical protein
MLRTASIAFVLRAGVRYTAMSSQPPSRFRTVQAMVDTILFARLKQAQTELFKMLQRLVFRSAGYLNRDQVYPVALVFFQLLRMLCISSSHLSNIEQRFKPKGRTTHLLLKILAPNLALTFIQYAGQQISRSYLSNLFCRPTWHSSGRQIHYYLTSTRNCIKISSRVIRS